MRSFLVLGIAMFTAALGRAADWPQFLGPTRDNVSPEAVEPWKDGPKVLWKQPVGEAHSSPVVAGGVVYVFFKPAGKDDDALAAFDAKTGNKKWEQSYPRDKFTPLFGTGPRGTPSVVGKQVFTLGNTGVLAAWSTEDGKVQWKVDTLKGFMAKNLFFGISTSPIVVGDQVILMVGGKGAGIVSFSIKDGKTLWQATDDTASYAGPMVDGERLVFLTGNHLRCIDRAGRPVWQFPFKDALNESSTTPVRVDDLIVGGSVTKGSVAFKADGSSDKPTWVNEKLTCYFSTPTVVGTDLYMINGAATIRNPTIVLRCVDGLTGDIRWEHPKVGKYHAAMIRTKNNKLLMLDDAGRLTLLEPNATEYKQLAQTKVCGETWAHPALADGVLYLRDNKELIALKLAE